MIKEGFEAVPVEHKIWCVVDVYELATLFGDECEVDENMLVPCAVALTLLLTWVTAYQ